MRSWIPPEEILYQTQPGSLTFLRMELRAGDVVTSDHRRHRPAIVDARQFVLRVVRLGGEGMDEVDIELSLL